MNRILWPFPVNWRTPFEVSYSFKTDIFTASSGVEQRRAVRRTPRKTVRFSATFVEDKLRRFNRLMATAQNMEIVMPEVTRRAVVAAYNAGTAEVILTDPRPGWLNVGGEVILNGRVGEIETVAADRFTLVDPLDVPVAAGDVAYHALTGRLDSRIDMKRLTNTVADGQIILNVLPGSEIISEEPAVPTFAGREVMMQRHNWRNGQDVSHDWPINVIDYDGGVISVRTPIDFPAEERGTDILLRGSTDAEALLGFFQRMRGRRGEFVRATGEPDLIPAGLLVDGQNKLLIDGRETFDTYVEDPVHQAIVVEAAGLSMFRSIIGLALVGEDTEIMVDALWPINGIVTRASWAYRSRLVSDDLTITWLTDSTATATLASRTLPWLGAVDYAALRAVPAGEDRETPEGEQRMVLYV